MYRKGAQMEKQARRNRSHALILEIDGERHEIGVAQANADGTFDCTTDMLNYHRTRDGGVRGFYFDPTTVGEQEPEPEEG